MRKLHALGGLLLALFFGLGLPLCLLLAGCAYHNTTRETKEGLKSSSTSWSFFDDSSMEVTKSKDGDYSMKRGDTVSAQLGATVGAAVQAAISAGLKAAVPVASGADGAPVPDNSALIAALQAALKQAQPPAVTPPAPQPKPPAADLKVPLPDLAPKPVGP